MQDTDIGDTSGESCETTHSNLSPESHPETEKRSIKALAILEIRVRSNPSPKGMI